jgi:hypothetical protein
MTERITHRHKFVAYAAMTVFVLVVLGTPAVQSIIAETLVEFVTVTERIVRIPSWLLDHERCFSPDILDRLDPTCPQCI